MSPHTFPTSPAAEGVQRKFVNPTPWFIGANVFGPDGKPTAIPVEPGGEVWLTPAEERMTAEAPRSADDNPFIKQWEEGVEFDPVTGEATRSVTRHGILVLADEPPRPTASDRFIPERGSTEVGATPVEGSSTSDEEMAQLRAERDSLRAELAERDRSAESGEPEPEVEAADEPEPAEEVTGAPPLPEQPPVEGQPAPDEVVGTPEAVAANDAALAQREPTAEQPTKPGAIAV